MAIFFPPIKIIESSPQKPTEGEWELIRFFTSTTANGIPIFDDSYEIFFNPFLDGDRPDFIILKKGYGVIIIEVKDWDG